MLSWNFKIISVNFMFPLYIVMPALEASRASLVAQMVKESVCSAGDPGSILGLKRSPGEQNDNPFQESCLENS